jgi:hypothetical protein
MDTVTDRREKIPPPRGQVSRLNCDGVGGGTDMRRVGIVLVPIARHVFIIAAPRQRL